MLDFYFSVIVLAVNRGGFGGPPVGMGSFGQWEGPMRGGGGMGVTTEELMVPANKTGLVIGKGTFILKFLEYIYIYFWFVFCFLKPILVFSTFCLVLKTIIKIFLLSPIDKILNI